MGMMQILTNARWFVSQLMFILTIWQLL